MLVKGLAKTLGASDAVATVVDIAVTGFTAFKAIELIANLFSPSEDRSPPPRVYTPPPPMDLSPAGIAKMQAASDLAAEKSDRRAVAQREYECAQNPWSCRTDFMAEEQVASDISSGSGYKIDPALLANFQPGVNMKKASSEQAAMFSSAHTALTDAAATGGLVRLNPSDNNGWTGMTHDENGTPIYTDAEGNIAVGRGDSATVYDSNGNVTREGKAEQVASSAPTTLIISSLI